MFSRRDRRLGSAFVEFVLVQAFFLVPLILGLMSVGFALTRSLQVAQLTRDVGRMSARGVDFSEPANQELIVGSSSRPTLPALAAGLGMTTSTGDAKGGTSGNGVVVLSSLTRISATCNCTNAGQIVLSRRIVVGNRNLFTSTFGNPASSLIDNATGAVSNYMQDTTTQASSFSSVVNLSSGEVANLVETKFTFPGLAIPGIMPNPGVAWRAVF
jgi:hypothetical protein